MANFMTSPGWAWPGRPIALSTAFQSVPGLAGAVLPPDCPKDRLERSRQTLATNIGTEKVCGMIRNLRGIRILVHFLSCQAQPCAGIQFNSFFVCNSGGGYIL